MTQTPATETSFAVCIQNAEYTASLERRKIYQLLPDPEAAKHQLVRVIDESGDDYLYPANYFVQIDLPTAIKNALLQAT
jgi:hypothetical protein